MHSPFNYHVWLSPTTSAVSQSSKAKLVYFNIKTFIERCSIFPEIKFLSVICVHFPFSRFPKHFHDVHKFPCFRVFALYTLFEGRLFK